MPFPPVIVKCRNRHKDIAFALLELHKNFSRLKASILFVSLTYKENNDLLQAHIRKKINFWLIISYYIAGDGGKSPTVLLTW